MSKTHLKIDALDCRSQGQTEFEYSHQTACGYVRKLVIRNKDLVNCFYCLRSKDVNGGIGKNG